MRRGRRQTTEEALSVPSRSFVSGVVYPQRCGLNTSPFDKLRMMRR